MQMTRLAPLLTLKNDITAHQMDPIEVKFLKDEVRNLRSKLSLAEQRNMELRLGNSEQ